MTSRASELADLLRQIGCGSEPGDRELHEAAALLQRLERDRAALLASAKALLNADYRDAIGSSADLHTAIAAAEAE